MTRPPRIRPSTSGTVSSPHAPTVMPMMLKAQASAN